MPEYSSTEARARFCELIARAERGEEVVITRRGKPVIQMRPVGNRSTSDRVPLDKLKRFRNSMPHQAVTTAEIIRQLRDEEDASH